MAFKLDKFGAEVSNAKSILGGISYYRYAKTNDDDITVAGYFPASLRLKKGDRIWVTPKVKTEADVLYVVSNVSDKGVITVSAAIIEDKTIQVETLPEASADELGKIYQFVGATGDTYTNGYFYKCQKTAITYTGTVSFEAATLSGTTVACSGDDFANFLTEAGADPTPIVSGTMTYDAGAGGWRLVGKDAEDNTVTNFLEYNEDYADHGFTFTGTPVDGDVVAFTCTVAEDTVTYGWVRIDVQPIPTAAEIGAVTQTVRTISLASTDWSSHTQTKTVTGVTADNTVIVAPAPASAVDYASASILCTAQAADSLTFTCTIDPTNNISVNVVILN